MNNVFGLIPAVRAAAIILALSAMPWLKVLAAAKDVDNGDEKIDPGLALAESEKFNWGVLVAVSKKAPDSLQFEVGEQKKTNNAVWETWADDPFTFPAMPDPAKPPQWKDRNKGERLDQIEQLNLRAAKFAPLIPDRHPPALLTEPPALLLRNTSTI